MQKEIMSAVVIEEFGGPEVLSFKTNVPVPEIASNQVLIKSFSTSVNPLDIARRTGLLAIITGRKFPQIIGNDLAGEIVRKGADVKNFQIGEQVFCLSDGNTRFAGNHFAGSGSYAEYCVTREDTLALIPRNIDPFKAAALPVTALTAYQAIFKIGNALRGQSILINGASGGVGTMAVQIAKSMGLTITAVCREDSFNLVKTLGADRVLDYRVTDFTLEKDQYDIIYDVIANRTFNTCINVLKRQGVYISNVANLSTILGTTFYRLKKLFGFAKKNTHAWVKPDGEDLQVIVNMVENGLTPVIDKVFPLTEAIQAHRYFEGNSIKGKVILKI